MIFKRRTQWLGATRTRSAGTFGLLLGPMRRFLEHAPFVSVHKDYVDIGAVVQLLAAELAKPKQAASRRIPAPFGILMIGSAMAIAELQQTDVPNALQRNVG